jgi:hypothetical protein
MRFALPVVLLLLSACGSRNDGSALQTRAEQERQEELLRQAELAEQQQQLAREEAEAARRAELARVRAEQAAREAAIAGRDGENVVQLDEATGMPERSPNRHTRPNRRLSPENDPLMGIGDP